MSKILNYIVKSISESKKCEFFLTELSNEEEKPNIQAIITQVEDYFQDEVIIVNRETILFINCRGFVVNDEFYVNQKLDPLQKLRIC